MIVLIGRLIFRLSFAITGLLMLVIYILFLDQRVTKKCRLIGVTILVSTIAACVILWYGRTNLIKIEYLLQPIECKTSQYYACKAPGNISTYYVLQQTESGDCSWEKVSIDKIYQTDKGKPRIEDVILEKYLYVPKDGILYTDSREELAKILPQYMNEPSNMDNKI